MSDHDLRRFERAHRANPTADSAIALAYAAERAGQVKLPAFKPLPIPSHDDLVTTKVLNSIVLSTAAVEDERYTLDRHGRWITVKQARALLERETYRVIREDRLPWGETVITTWDHMRDLEAFMTTCVGGILGREVLFSTDDPAEAEIGHAQARRRVARRHVNQFTDTANRSCGWHHGDGVSPWRAPPLRVTVTADDLVHDQTESLLSKVGEIAQSAARNLELRLLSELGVPDEEDE